MEIESKHSETKRTVGIVTTWFSRGAAFVSKQYLEILQGDCNVEIYARGGEQFPMDDPKWAFDNVWWGEFTPGSMKTFIDIKDFKNWLDHKGIDVLIFNEQQSWDVIVWLKTNTRIPTISYIDYYTKETVPYFNLFDNLLCHTRRHQSVFKDHLKSHYLPWGVDLEKFQSPKPISPITFFHNAGMSLFRKGTDLILKAVSSIDKTKFKFKVIIHAQVPTSEVEALEGFDDPRIEWIHEEVDPPGLYHKGDIYLYPSRLDGLGLSLPEALASGLPAIVPDEAPMNEFVEDGRNGYTIEVKKRWSREDGYFWEMNELNVDTLKETMQKLILDPELVRELQIQTKKLSASKLDRRQNFSELASIIQECSFREPNPQILADCILFEKRNTPQISTKQKLHRILIAMGGRKVKRSLLGRK